MDSEILSHIIYKKDTAIFDWFYTHYKTLFTENESLVKSYLTPSMRASWNMADETYEFIKHKLDLTTGESVELSYRP